MFGLKNKSCLSILVRIVLMLVVLFVLGNGYAALRMELAKAKRNRLAQQLGYTPTAALVDGVSSHDVNLVTGTASVSISDSFITSMKLADFESRLGNVAPHANKLSIGNINQILTMFTVDGVDGWQLKNPHLMPKVPQHCWSDLSGFFGQNRFICLYETAETDYYLEFNGEHVTGNIVTISVKGGTIPVWMNFGVVLWSRLRGY